MNDTPKSTVIVSEDRKAVHAYNPVSMEAVLVGYMVSRIYEGERVQRHSFTPEKNPLVNTNSQQGEFSLGPTTLQFNFVDHIAAMDPLLQAGYKIRDQIVGKGGLQVYSVLEPEDPVILRDPITWDHGIWKVDPKSKPTLTETIIFNTAIRPGKGINYRRGVFRQICSNGLVAEILGMGSARFNHANWSAEGVEGLVRDRKLNKKSGVSGPMVGNTKGINAFINLLERYAGTVEGGEGDGDDEAAAPDIAADPSIPFYIAKHLNPLLRMPNWWTDQFISQLKALRDHGKGSAHVLDILNAVTSPVSLERNSNPDRAVLRPLAKLNTLVDSCCQFIGIFSL